MTGSLSFFSLFSLDFIFSLFGTFDVVQHSDLLFYILCIGFATQVTLALSSKSNNWL